MFYNILYYVLYHILIFHFFVNFKVATHYYFLNTSNYENYHYYFIGFCYITIRHRSNIPEKSTKAREFYDT